MVEYFLLIEIVSRCGQRLFMNFALKQKLMSARDLDRKPLIYGMWRDLVGFNETKSFLFCNSKNAL